ncbi:MAG: hypothetical protein WCI34_03545 [Actinomycetes bacterium]
MSDPEGWVRVAVASSGPEGEMLASRLQGEGIPSMIVRSGGFDVPGFLAAGPRDVLVPPEAEARARALLGTASDG